MAEREPVQLTVIIDADHADVFGITPGTYTASKYHYGNNPEHAFVLRAKED